MNFLLLTLLALPAICNAFSLTDAIVASWKQSTGTTNYGALTDVYAIYYTSTNVFVKAKGMPSYSIGPWLVNPFTPSGQNWVFSFTATPTAKTGAKTDLTIKAGPIGVWSNGIPIFNANDAQSYNNQGVWHQNALVFEGGSFDACNGHPDSSGIYHNHVMVICMFNSTNSAAHSPIIGYAFDSFPIYGPFGYTNPASAASAIKRMASSYRTRVGLSTRTTLVNGSTVTAGPTVSTTYPAGAYIEDYEYVPNLGDLDICNGRTTITPEYPNGTYAYFVTTDSTGAPVYPFHIGPCYYGNQITPNGAVVVPASASKHFDLSTATSVTTTRGLASCAVLIVILALF